MRWKFFPILLTAAGCAFVTDKAHEERIDVDGDGLVSVEYPGGTDCDDRDRLVGVGDPWFLDADRDGAGDPDVSVAACTQPEGHVDNDLDCDDTSAGIAPGADELCNGIDDDCDGTPDDGLPTETAYADMDGDGYGDASEPAEFCLRPTGWAANDDDCDDSNDDIAPGADELCNGEDEDCDGQIDEGLNQTPWYRDADLDGYGDRSDQVAACAAPDGYVANNEDCEDDDFDVNPAGREVCNGEDDDCDGVADDGLPRSTWHPDRDGDGFGDDSETVVDCAAPDGWVDPGGDCNDEVGTIFPTADEACNGLDDDCDGLVDDGLPVNGTYYGDGDGDGYGVAGTTIDACAQPPSYADETGDCDDDNPNVSPGSAEVCGDLVDDDCDGDRPQCGPFGDLGAGSVAYLSTEATADLTGASVMSWRRSGATTVAVGAPERVGAGGRVGGVYVLAAPRVPGVTSVAAGARIEGVGVGGHFGAAVAGGFDIDGDGGLDIAIGSPDEGSGRVRLIHQSSAIGTVSARSVTVLTISGGGGVSGVGGALVMGDVTDDGDADLVIGAPRSRFAGSDPEGAVVIFEGPISGSAYPEAIYVGNSDDETGTSIAWLEDVDGDGVPDLAIGSPGDGPDKGRTSLILGPVPNGVDDLSDVEDAYFDGPVGSRSGTSLAGADVDDDGRTDIVIGAPDVDEDEISGRGAVYVVHGSSDPENIANLINTLRLLGAGADSGLGSSVASAGDTDGDGVHEIIVGAPKVGAGRGRAYLWAPPASGVTLSDMCAEFPARHPLHQIGSSVASAGDVDGNGFDDFWVGATGSRPGGLQEGAASLVFGGLP